MDNCIVLPFSVVSLSSYPQSILRETQNISYQSYKIIILCQAQGRHTWLSQVCKCTKLLLILHVSTFYHTFPHPHVHSQVNVCSHYQFVVWFVLVLIFLHATHLTLASFLQTVKCRGTWWGPRSNKLSKYRISSYK